MTSTKGNDTLMPELLKLVTSNGTDSMREVFQKLLNTAVADSVVIQPGSSHPNLQYDIFGIDLNNRSPD